MVKVFLVEDEVIMRNGIRDNIDWKKEDLEFVGEAGDGELAYPLIKKSKPDILITDIQMPFMDGLELSRIVKNEMPGIKIIILSGYGEFDYAKQAISIGVTDYLLKPISSAKLLEAIHQIAELIEQERKKDRLLEQYQKDMEESSRMERQKLYSHLVSGGLSSTDILEQGRRLGIEFSSAAYIVLRFQIQAERAGGQSSSVERLREEICCMAEQEPEIRLAGLGAEGFAFILGGEDEGDVYTLLDRWSRQLRALIRSSPGIHYFGGIGKLVFRLGDIPKSYQVANRTFASRFFLDLDQIVDQAGVEQLRSAAGARIDVEELRGSKTGRKRIESFLKNGTADETEEYIKEYFENVGEQNYKSLMFRQYIVMDMYLVIADFLEEIGADTRELSPQSRDVNEIAANPGPQAAVEQYLVKLFQEALGLRDKLSQKRYGQLLEEARAYIKDSFQNHDLSLNTVAGYVCISPSYFSTIFSQETGKTFVEYVTELRIEKARELLMCTNLRTAEVGYQAGYKDSHYFSYIFKKMTGCSPKEYRMRGKEQQGE